MGCERWLLLVLLVGCGPDDDTGDTTPDRNGVQVRFGLPDAEWDDDDDTAEDDDDGGLHDGDLALTRLELRVAGVLFEGVGPGGEVAASNDAVAVVDVVTGAGAADVAVVDLVQGTYEPAALSVHLAADVGPALRLVGRWDETAVELIVEDDVVLQAVADRFVLPDGPDPIVEFGLHPGAWFDDDEIPELAEGQKFVVSPDQNAALYDVVVARIVATTEGSFP